MWLTGRLAPDFKTIADFRKDNGPAIRATCRRFALLCRDLDLPSEASVAVDGSKSKAADARERNRTPNVVRGAAWGRPRRAWRATSPRRRQRTGRRRGRPARGRAG